MSSNRHDRGSECIPADGVTVRDPSNPREATDACYRAWRSRNTGLGFDLYHAGFEAGYAAALSAKAGQ